MFGKIDFFGLFSW